MHVKDGKYCPQFKAILNKLLFNYNKQYAHTGDLTYFL